MILSLILAAEEAAKKSEAPFFIAGALLVAFALAISVVGMKKPDFPADDGATRGVYAVSMLFVAAAMVAIVYVSN